MESRDFHGKKVVFLDMDGVLTSISDGNSYLCGRPADYSISEKCLANLMRLLDETDAVVVISSNWRRFPDEGHFTFEGQQYKNQLPVLKKLLGERYWGDIPHDRHMTKSTGIILWAEDNGVDLNDGSFDYVIIDDMQYEMDDATVNMLHHFILCDEKVGFTEEDAVKAKMTLNS